MAFDGRGRHTTRCLRSDHFFWVSIVVGWDCSMEDGNCRLEATVGRVETGIQTMAAGLPKTIVQNLALMRWLRERLSAVVEGARCTTSRRDGRALGGRKLEPAGLSIAIATLYLLKDATTEMTVRMMRFLGEMGASRGSCWTVYYRVDAAEAKKTPRRWLGERG